MKPDAQAFLKMVATFQEDYFKDVLAKAEQLMALITDLDEAELHRLRWTTAGSYLGGILHRDDGQMNGYPCGKRP